LRLARDICATAIIFLLFLAAAEGAFHAAHLRFQGSFYSSDRSLGYVLRPNAHGWNVSENVNYFTVNSDGLADRDHVPQRPPGVIRIAIVGDSVSEAKQVPRTQAYWSVMERNLNSSLAPRGQKVEVINFGVAGYGLAQDSLVIQNRVWKYDPQIIILAGTIESLILRGTRDLSPSNGSEHVPFYQLQNGALVPDRQTQMERASFSDSGRLHTLLGDALNSIQIAALCNEGVKKAAEQANAFLGKKTTLNQYKETDAFLGPSTPALKSAWDISEALILQSSADARRHHAEFWLFTLDMPEQVDPDDAARSAFERSLGIHDLFISDNLFATFAGSKAILHGTLAPQLLDAAKATHTILHGFPGGPRNSGHWNESGHRVAGDLMAKTLLASSRTIPR
jgi:hypothetical protein